LGAAALQIISTPICKIKSTELIKGVNKCNFMHITYIYTHQFTFLEKAANRELYVLGLLTVAYS
jgi:hypothetical protein